MSFCIILIIIPHQTIHTEKLPVVNYNSLSLSSTDSRDCRISSYSLYLPENTAVCFCVQRDRISVFHRNKGSLWVLWKRTVKGALKWLTLQRRDSWIQASMRPEKGIVSEHVSLRQLSDFWPTEVGFPDNFWSRKPDSFAKHTAEPKCIRINYMIVNR